MSQSKKMSGATIQVPFARKVLGFPGHRTSAFNRCVGGKMRGFSGDLNARIKHFTESAKGCKGTKGK